MGKKGCSRLFVALLLVFVLGSSAWAASISGTVTNSSGKSGRVYLSVQSTNYGDTGRGVSIASPGGAFQINGVDPGSYTVKAFMDTQGDGIQSANEPTGASGQVNVSTGTVSVGAISLYNPSSVAAEAPKMMMVYRGNGGNFVLWDGPTDDYDHPIADKYTVSWSTSPTGPATGSKDVAPGNNDFFAHGGGASALYYQVTAVAGATTASTAWTQGPAVSASGSVTGKVSFPGLIPTGPLYVVLVNFSKDIPVFNVAAITSPVSDGSYTINNVSPGTYEVYAFLDLNNNGAYDTGDVGWLDNSDFNTTVTVSTSLVSAADISLKNVNAATTVSTTHGKNESGEWYNINLDVLPMKKQVLNAQITSGPQISTPLDLAREPWNNRFNAWFNVARPTVGDNYKVKLTYADLTTETIDTPVSGVLDSFATPQAPIGYIAYNPTPTFSWTAPASAPAEYVYSLWLNEANNYNGWEAWGLSSSLTSLAYGSQGDVYQDTLTDGSTYNWTLTVTDRNGNQAQNQASFTPTSSPAISDFSPPGGLAGTTVTISGINFNPNPSSNVVLFNGVTATISAATSTSLTVTVPAGATTGKIQVNNVQSVKDFTVAAPIHINGVIKTSGNVVIAGARVEKTDDPSVYTTTDANGAYTLNSLFPNQNVTLRISKSGYVPTYTTNYLQENLDLTPYPNHLYTQAEITAWGVSAGKGVIVGQILNIGSGTIPYPAVGGVVVTAQSSQNFQTYYPVTYYSGTSFGGTSTYGNGFFFVLNVDNYDWVNLNAGKSSWNFSPSGSNAYANSVTETGIFGNAPAPYFFNISPLTGTPGTSVTISGNNFSSIPAENIVTFNGVPATVTNAGTGSLTVTVPSGATSGTISVTTAGGTVAYWLNFTMRYTLTASAAGSGGALGTVTSSPVGISCRTGGCTADYDQGTTVGLFATPDSGSVLDSWNGACNGNGACNFTMNTNKSVAATFTMAPVAKNMTTSISYPTLAAALSAASPGSMIYLLDSQLDGVVTLNKQLNLKGGWNASFDGKSGLQTLLNGNFTVTSGDSKAETIDVKGKLSIQGGSLRVSGVNVK
ncbi:MAG: IPT/TIG domain-containing protein [Desulfuromonadales bacterium]|nr:IPT/TIG domain-containing protein [Desulfuromonadales bacterium]